jgi:hypothetical protein
MRFAKTTFRGIDPYYVEGGNHHICRQCHKPFIFKPLINGWSVGICYFCRCCMFDGPGKNGPTNEIWEYWREHAQTILEDSFRSKKFHDSITGDWKYQVTCIVAEKDEIHFNWEDLL